MPTADGSRLARLTTLCAGLPNTSRLVTGRHAQFLVGKKTFAYYLDDNLGDGIVSVSCKCEPGANAELVAADPVRFYLPKIADGHDWIGLRLDLETVDWHEVNDLLRTSYRLVAPQRLIDSLD
ncbi:MAG: MmcQ/YjbR family DNA-binding protein [Candidatus Eremiobacteraeota bacterium]|nr:MmcQ/YjbR family DNA-binding protein [Candidatus Eremiobacteraeota bacterium]